MRLRGAAKRAFETDVRRLFDSIWCFWETRGGLLLFVVDDNLHIRANVACELDRNRVYANLADGVFQHDGALVHWLAQRLFQRRGNVRTGD